MMHFPCSLTKWGWLIIFIMVGISIGIEILSKMKSEMTCDVWSSDGGCLHCISCGIFEFCNQTLNKGGLTNKDYCNKLWIEGSEKK